MKRTRNKNANGGLFIKEPQKTTLRTIYFDYCYKGKRFRLSTGQKVFSKFWDNDKQKAKRGQDLYMQINLKLESFANNAKEVIRRFLEAYEKGEATIPTIDQIKKALGVSQKTIEVPTKAPQENLFNILFDDFFQYKKNTGEISKKTFEGYVTFKTQFNEFLLLHQIVFNPNDFTSKNVNDFIVFYKEVKNITHNTLVYKLAILKCFFTYLKLHKKIAINEDVFLFKYSNFETIRAVFTWQEIQKLMCAEIRKDFVFFIKGKNGGIEYKITQKQLEQTRNIILFAVFTGLRYSDIRKLTLSQVTKENNQTYIKIIIKKTKKTMTLALNDYALAELEKSLSISPNGYIRKGVAYCFPVKDNRIQNTFIKILLKELGFDKLVEVLEWKDNQMQIVQRPQHEVMTMHNFRHSFGVLSVQKGLRVEMLQKQLGHSNIETTMIYAKIAQNESNQETLDVWNKKD